MFKAILWDNDGVLVDTEGVYFEATSRILAEVGVSLTRELYIEHFLNRSTGVQSVLDELGVSGLSVKDLRHQRNELYSRLITSKNTLIPHVKDVVQSLARKFRMAIVTSSRRDHFDVIHRETEILQYFELVLTNEDYQLEKPSPAPYLKALELMELSPSECLVIEDSGRGLAAAKSAGCTCWVVASHLTTGINLNAADKSLDSIKQLPALLDVSLESTANYNA